MSRDRARDLRKHMTDTERFVWQRIRYRQIGGFKFRRQHPLGPFVVDFVCLERKLVLELDGGQHSEWSEYDERRSAWLRERGYRVFRVWNHEALQDWDVVAEKIGELLKVGVEATPHPAVSEAPAADLPLKGGGQNTGGRDTSPRRSAALDLPP